MLPNLLRIFRKQKQTKLTLRQVHELYLLLRHSLPEEEKGLLIDQIDAMLDRMSSGDVMVKAVEIMYGKIRKQEKNPLNILLLFVQGLRQSDFFEYVGFVQGMKSEKH